MAQNVNEKRWRKIITCYEEAEIQDQDPKVFCRKIADDLITGTRDEITKLMPQSEEDYTIKQYKAYSKCKNIVNKVERLECQLNYCCPSQKKELDSCLDSNSSNKEFCHLQSSKITKCYAEFARKAFVYDNEL
eukprot:TRINITY_DN2613_c0_g1_i1.p1 TRINITY_DN2613_c0_g1~~TRINITY_DN2613_c0_g1_i1.p1  ORF type:complete len:133 (-),score=37.92 TRINITY_DN2613_c0_g1_i1:82-480(-)